MTKTKAHQSVGWPHFASTIFSFTQYTRYQRRRRPNQTLPLGVTSFSLECICIQNICVERIDFLKIANYDFWPRDLETTCILLSPERTNGLLFGASTAKSRWFMFSSFSTSFIHKQRSSTSSFQTTAELATGRVELRVGSGWVQIFLSQYFYAIM